MTIYKSVRYDALHHLFRLGNFEYVIISKGINTQMNSSGSVGHIEYKQGGPQYANESKIWYSCNEDRERSRPFTSEEDYDLICIDVSYFSDYLTDA